MKYLGRLVILVTAAVVVILGCQSTGVKEQVRNPALFGWGGPRGEMTTDEMLGLSSSGKLKVSEARVIIDNDAAFAAKIDALRSAKKGETVRLAYFIYSDDYSSSYFTNELIKASQRGVKVKLLVDFLGNYKFLDLFSYLEDVSNGAIQVRLFGRPTDKIVRDMGFLTQPCPSYPGKTPPSSKYCSDYKWNNNPKSPDFFAKLLMSGIYGRGVTALKVSLLMGQQIDLAKYKEGQKMSDEQKEQLKEFFKLVYDAKVKGDTLASLKVTIALHMYADELVPMMNEILGRLPLDQMNNSSAADWEHLSDFIHHKILLIDGRYLQLGGRNIEDSYHMKANPLIAKYIFMDTDFAAKIQSGGESIAKSYDELWNFTAMTMPVKQVRELIPNDYVTNPMAFGMAVQACSKPNYSTVQDRAEFAACVEKTTKSQQSYKDLAARMKDVVKNMSEKMAKYVSDYKPQYIESWTGKAAYDDHVPAQDMKNMTVAYIENVHYDRSKAPNDRDRKYGVTAGQEAKSGKYIHRLWVRGLENVCAATAKERTKNPSATKRVVLHSAYFLPPSPLVRSFTKMMDGTWDCRGVHVTFLTNSFESTDLNWINFLAKYEMLTFFQMYNDRKNQFGSMSERAAQFDYYEYKLNPNARYSLHTKLSVLGDDMIIGSANSDVRSYYMDTNNGVYIRNAPELTRQYLAFVDQIIKSDKVDYLTPNYINGSYNKNAFREIDKKQLESYLAKLKVSEETKAKILERGMQIVGDITDVVSDSTQKMMDTDYIETDNNTGETGTNYNSKLEEQRKIEQRFNRLFQLF
jgi:phosphatidylserine/phosphatidylglycerophosphate/cardiolipin synthase-like enzyme